MAQTKVTIDLDRTYVLSVGVSLAAPYVADTTRMVLNRARVLCPKDTSNLANSLTMVIRARRTFVAGTISTKVKYATYVHEGTKPHKIYPKKKGALSFEWGAVGVRVFVPKKPTSTGYRTSKKRGTYFVIGKGYVNHPGTKARPFLRDALIQIAGAKQGFAITSLGDHNVFGEEL